MTPLNEFDKRIRMYVYFLSEFEPDKRIFGFEFGFGFEIRLVVSEFPPLKYPASDLPGIAVKAGQNAAP